MVTLIKLALNVISRFVVYFLLIFMAVVVSKLSDTRLLLSLKYPQQNFLFFFIGYIFREVCYAPFHNHNTVGQQGVNDSSGKIVLLHFLVAVPH